MRNGYATPNMTLFAHAEDAMMLYSNAGGAGGDGAIELPPIPMKQESSYTPPSLAGEEAPTDILMASGEVSGGGDGGMWGDGSADIEMPLIPMN